MKIRLTEKAIWILYAIIMTTGFVLLSIGLSTDTLHGTIVGLTGLFIWIIGTPALMMFSMTHPEYDKDEIYPTNKTIKYYAWWWPTG